MIQTYIGSIKVVTCGECGITFGMDESFYNRKKQDHSTWYCPNGHNRVYTGKTDKDLLQDKLDSIVKDKDRLLHQRDELYHRIEQLGYSVRAQKAAKTKILNRVKNGVCPCCNRTFQNLQNHFKSVHPELLEKVKD